MVDSIKETVLEALDDAKAKDPKAFMVSNIVTYADWVFIASANSNPHLKSVVRRVEEAMLKIGIKSKSVEGLNADSGWILIDFGDVIVHVLSEEKRDFYQLEKLFTLEI